MVVWFSVFLLALAVLALLWRLVNPLPRLEIGERGILQRGGWGWILWDEIEGAYPPTADDTDTMRLRLRATDRPAGESRVEGSVEVRLDLAGSDLNAIDVLQEILTHNPTATAAEPTDDACSQE